jgi:adenylate cyclase
MPQRWKFPLTVLLLAGCLGAALSGILKQADLLDGLLHDLALIPAATMRTATDGPSPVAVIALDDASLDAPELATIPRAMMSPVWADLIGAMSESGVKALAFDFLFVYSGNRFAAGHDRPFLRALAANRDLVVLGRSAGKLPARPFLAALRMNPGNLGMLELHADADGIYRSGKMHATDDMGASSATLSAAALTQAGLAPPATAVRLAPYTPLDSLPTYSLIDVLQCARTDPASLRKAFAGRMVFVGTTLAEEDRKISSDRFLRRSAQPAGRDRLCEGAGTAAPGRRDVATVPGVYLHAALAAAVANDSVVNQAAHGGQVLFAATMATAGAGLALWFTPAMATVAVIGVGFLVWLVHAGLLAADIWLPAGLPLVLLAAAAAFTYGARYLLEDRQRRLVQKAFGHYLSPVVVDGLLSAPERLRLGGNARDLSIMFADLSGFTALSTKISAEELVETTNRYLGLIVGEVERTGGYVDKFIGDAVMVMWGAPAPDVAHARHATQSALAVAERVANAARTDAGNGKPGFGVKIGIASGSAIVGNVGTEKRFNFTAVGETVNIAARLEGLPGVYQCTVIIDPQTAAQVGDEFVLREIDQVAVKGRSEPLAIYEPMGTPDRITSDVAELIERYAQALALYRNRQFSGARAIWLGLSELDGPSRVMAERAASFIDEPPPQEWDGVWRMTSK